jgi:hypothetical protein
LATQLLKITLEYIERIFETRRNVEKAFWMKNIRIAQKNTSQVG